LRADDGDGEAFEQRQIALYDQRGRRGMELNPQ
jgi:hypothetical protein